MKLSRINFVILVSILLLTSCAKKIRLQDTIWDIDISNSNYQGIAIRNDTIFINNFDTIKKIINEYTGVLTDTSFYITNKNILKHDSVIAGGRNGVFIRTSKIKNSNNIGSIVRYELIKKSPWLRGGRTKYKLLILYSSNRRRTYRFISKFEFIENIVPYKENMFIVKWNTSTFYFEEVKTYISLIELVE